MDHPEIATATDALQDRFKSSEEWVRQEELREARRQQREDAELERTLIAWGNRRRRARVIYFLFLNSFLALLYVTFEITDSNLLNNIMQNNRAIIALVFVYLCVSLIFLLFPYGSSVSNDYSSFAEIDRRHQESKVELAKIAESKVEELAEGLTDVFNKAATTISVEGGEHSSFEFDYYVRKVISDLDNQISLSDEKASKLLDKGVWYLGAGLIFYISAIFFWQFWAKGEELSAVVVLGMLSCTVAFVVIEFLAAWFLKQYRSFVDSSLSYARVKSHYDRCLLSYYSLVEFSSASEDVAVLRAEMLECLKREPHWPDSKQLNSNDFNYMLESMNSMTLALEKFRGLGKKSHKADAQEPT